MLSDSAKRPSLNKTDAICSLNDSLSTWHANEHVGTKNVIRHLIRDPEQLPHTSKYNTKG